jgi:hypothetical protein
MSSSPWRPSSESIPFDEQEGTERESWAVRELLEARESSLQRAGSELLGSFSPRRELKIGNTLSEGLTAASSRL